MNKCPKCGAEFEGKFCPNCGTEWRNERECPGCGAKVSVSANFCNNCGRRLTPFGPPSEPDQPVMTKKVVYSPSSAKGKVYKVLAILPRILFLLFFAMSFGFLALPLIRVEPNIFISAQSIGNAYDALKLSDPEEISFAFTIYFSAAVWLGAIFALIMLGNIFNEKKAGEKLLGGPSNQTIKEFLPSEAKKKPQVSIERDIKAESILYCIFYLLNIGFFSYVIYTIKSYDEGLGLLKAGACPILMIVFPVLFFVATVACGIVNNVLKKEIVYAPRVVYEARSSSQSSGWAKTHKKAIKNAVIVSILVILLAVAIPVGIIHRHDGTYYLYDCDTEEYNYSVYYKLNGNKLSDQTGESVKVKFDGDNFSVLADLFGSQVAAATGAVKGGVMKVSAFGVQTYAKKNHNHRYGTWETSIEPTCISDGRETRSCLCGHIDSRAIEKTGVHSYEDGICKWCGTVLLRFEPIEGGYSFAEYGAKSVTGDFVIPNYYMGLPVISIGANAFFGCRLTNITIPYSVTSIGDRAFYICAGLKSITIPDGVTSIGNNAFWGCDGLQKVIISNLAAWCGIEFRDDLANPLYYAHHLYMQSMDQEITELQIPSWVTEIKSYTFERCERFTSIEIGNGLKTIGECAFKGCGGLTSIKIGNGLKTIKDGAFSGCDALDAVYYKGTAEQWNGINIEDGNYELTDATRYYFSEGAPSAEQWASSEYWWHYDLTTSLPTPWTKDE